MGIVLDNLRYTTARDFRNSFSSGKYYLFASSLTDQDVSSNSDRSSRLFFEKTIFGKRILPKDVLFMVRKIIWTPGVVYSPYDDTVDLSVSQFYVISEPDSESGDFTVFKCISNNDGAASTDKPTYSSALASQNFFLRTADGYIWKYLYSITNSKAAAYSTTTLFPVMADPTVYNNAVKSIDRIVITNPATNFGYDSRTGTVISVATSSSGGLRTIVLDTGTSDPNNDYFRINGYYKGYTLYTTSQDGVTSRKYIIENSGVNANQRFFVSVGNYVNGDMTNGTWNYTITPTVEIIGDGTGASAISTVASGRITDVIVLNGGQDYTRARARIVQPTIGFNAGDTTSGDVACVLRVVPPPPAVYDARAGHGGNPAAELRARHVAISVSLDPADESVIPSTNTYSKVGVVKDPIFDSTFPLVFDNRIKIELTSVSQLNVGDIVTQSTTDFRGIVHTIDDINSIIYVTEFYGPYTGPFYLSGITPIDVDQPLTTPAGRVEIRAGGIVYPTYQMGSGELLYVTEFEPIERSENLAEQFKFIISF